jgi:non-homologous end joining protein Ku
MQPELLQICSLSNSAARTSAKATKHEKGRYVCISREELTAITPSTAREADIRQFVQPVEIDPVSVDNTFFVVPDLRVPGMLSLRR